MNIQLEPGDGTMNIGFCGAGLMGSAMVRRLLAHGHRMTVWNRSADKAKRLCEQGAEFALTPAEAGDGADLVVLCLTDETAVEHTVFGTDGLVHSDVPVIVDHSSISPAATCAFAARFVERSWIDAPVSGGVAGVEAGSLAVMAGGNAEALARILPALRCYSRIVTLMGPTGAGQTTKLCNQTIVSATIAAIAEAVVLASKSGVDANKLTEALSGGWADSILLKTFAPRMAAPDDKLLGRTALLLKDAENIRRAAMDSGTHMPVTSAVLQLLRNVCDNGFAEKDISSIATFLRSH
jgi:3-hydroxyisobutyrate dehydrogenase-like beta-hydroxyacid dehydrogenase